MSMLIVPEPLFDQEMAVDAYWLRSHDGTKMLGLKDDYRAMDEAFIHRGLNLVERIGLEPFTGGKPLFVNVTKIQLITGVLNNFDLTHEHLIPVVSAQLAADAEAVAELRALGERGYRFGLDGFPESVDPAIAEHVAYVMLDFQQPQFFTTQHKLRLQMPFTRSVIYNVPDVEAFASLKRDKRALFSGSFYNRPLTRKDVQLSPVKINALELLSHVNEEDFDLRDIVRTIERDPYLAVSLLKFLNSNASGLKKQVDSIQQAVAILGQKAVRQWAAVTLAVSLGEDRPNEITRIALVRAKFAESLAVAFELGVFQPSLFMAGLFSLLDVMLEKPMEQAINDVAVDARIRQVLVEKTGPFAPVMQLIYAYERADWDAVSILMIQNNTDMAHVSQSYLDALQWYRALLQSIDQPGEAQDAPADGE